MTHLDETQTMLRDSVQAFHERHPAPARVRRLRDQAIPFDRGVWQEMAQAGWSAVNSVVVPPVLLAAAPMRGVWISNGEGRANRAPSGFQSGSMVDGSGRWCASQMLIAGVCSQLNLTAGWSFRRRLESS